MSKKVIRSNIRSKLAYNKDVFISLQLYSLEKNEKIMNEYFKKLSDFKLPRNENHLKKLA